MMVQGAAAALPPPSPAPSFPKESRNLYCLLATSLVSILFVLSFSSSSSPSSSASPPPSSPISILSHSSSLPLPPSLAYLISGSNGDCDRLLRLLSAVYHPKNIYLLHLDLTASQDQRERLALAVQSHPVFRSAGNVHVIGNASFANQRGSSALASILRGAAVLLRLSQEWDWFINLDASDYPLVKQDDLLHVLSFLPRDLNFVQHTSNFSLKELRRVKPVIVDPSLYLLSKTDVYYGTQRREWPDAYRLFTGSPSVILSRKFIEFSILGTDNLPRSLLMYYANSLSSHANYFHTVICNSVQFNKTIVNDNLHYMSWDVPPKLDPRVLGLKDFENMTESGAAFGTRFLKDDPLLDHIDQELLNRLPGRVVAGGWCIGGADPCTVLGDTDVLRPGPGAKRLEKIIVQLLSVGAFQSRQCLWG